MDHQEYFEANGYVQFPRLVDAARIDSFLEHYRGSVVPSKQRFFRQNTSKYTRNSLTEHGYVTESFLDVHNYETIPAFREATLEICFSDAMLAALGATTGHPEFNLMSTTLFDLNTTTPAHQDWWYLDSVPKGGLLGAWIALEDIREEAGRFYFLPKTQHLDLLSQNPGSRHTEWLALMDDYVGDHRNELLAPALKKGDVLFWNSGLVHGSLPTQDDRYSRKSLVAHYLPSHMTYGNLFITKDFIRYQEYKGHKYFADQPEYSVMNDLKSKVKKLAYDNPALTRALRGVQERFRAARLSSD